MPSASSAPPSTLPTTAASTVDDPINASSTTDGAATRARPVAASIAAPVRRGVLSRGEAVASALGRFTGRSSDVVVRDGVAAVAPDAQAVAGEHELAGLGHDAALADHDVAVEQRQRADRNAGRVLALLLEGGGDDQLLAGRQLLFG